jgi:hypothetical protein
MMQPLPRSTIDGTTALEQKNAAESSPLSLASKASQGYSKKGTIGNWIEAFSTTVSIGPSRSTVSATMASTCSRSRTSACTASAEPPSASIAATTSWAGFSLSK